MEEKKQVSIPAELYDRLAGMLAKTGAESADELAARIIRDWVTKDSAPGAKKAQAGIAPEDEKVVEERLKSLGYL